MPCIPPSAVQATSAEQKYKKYPSSPLYGESGSLRASSTPILLAGDLSSGRMGDPHTSRITNTQNLYPPLDGSDNPDRQCEANSN